MANEYKVEITRTYIGTAKAWVLADNEEEAAEKAYTQAGDLEFSLDLGPDADSVEGITLIREAADHPRFVCQDCQAVYHEADALNPVQDLAERVGAGEPMPAGECVACGAVVHKEQ